MCEPPSCRLFVRARQSQVPSTSRAFGLPPPSKLSARPHPFAPAPVIYVLESTFSPEPRFERTACTPVCGVLRLFPPPGSPGFTGSSYRLFAGLLRTVSEFPRGSPSFFALPSGCCGLRAAVPQGADSPNAMHFEFELPQPSLHAEYSVNSVARGWNPGTTAYTTRFGRNPAKRRHGNLVAAPRLVREERRRVSEVTATAGD